MEESEPPCPSPAPPHHPPSSFLKDISNFKTPRRSSAVNPNFLNSPHRQFFTASKQTPKSSSSSFRRPSLVPSSSSRSKAAAAARRLRTFELQQSQSSRKEQEKKEQSLRSLARSLTVWLNFLFENPTSCGCYSLINDYVGGDLGASSKAKRDSGEAIRNSGIIGVDVLWRSPKRLRDLGWRVEEGSENDLSLSGSKYSLLTESLRDVCSFDDLKKRMRIYMSLGSCKEIFDVMTRVAKNIDEGRIKMKPHCPVVTDVGMKEKAIRTLMCYNQIWLRIGLYIIFGGDSLLSDVDVNSDPEMAFLKMVIDKQFLSHAGLAKAYAYNKMVEGLYRPGYYEALGTVILKRILLLVLILDRAKSQSCLSLKYGLDGIDGGSPLLFSVKSSIKSSHQLINEFLSSDVMHGEGNLLAHLVIIGYKIPYQQSPLVEYDFRVKDLFVDLQDGVRLCRAIQLLLNDPSIYMKIVVPSDTRKKNLAICGIALQYLKKAGVPLKDDEGMMIVGDDVANGDKELTLSLLWNMFVHLQLPLLINQRLLVEEIHKARGLDVSNQINMSTSPSEMLLNWIQAISKKYDFRLESFASLVDGKGIWCLLDYYFRREVCCPCLHKQEPSETQGPRSVVSNTAYADAVHNFILSQKLTALLGSFPEVLQIGDLLEQNAAVSDRSVMILLAFLSSKLIIKENMDQLNFHKLLCSNCQALERRHSRVGYGSSGSAMSEEEVDRPNTEDATKRFKAIKAWWEEMANQKQNSLGKANNGTLKCFSTSKCTMDIQRENAATVIQANLRRLRGRRKFAKMMNVVCFLQAVIRTWLSVKKMQVIGKLTVDEFPMLLSERWTKTEPLMRYVKYIVERHRFIKLRKSASLIQQAARTWLAWTHKQAIYDVSTQHQSKPPVVVQTESDLVVPQEPCLVQLELEAACKIQLAWRSYKKYKNQSASAIIIQSYTRGWIARRTAWRCKFFALVIQRYCRGWLVRRKFSLLREAVVSIQNAVRCFNCLLSFHRHKYAAIEVQRLVRGQIAQHRLLEASRCCSQICKGDPRLQQRSFETKILASSVIKLQRWWKSVMSHKARIKSSVIIQRHIRGLIARQRTSRERHHIVMIQSHWKGYLARKASRAQVMDLRLRMQTSAANIDDKKRLINKLLSALSELLNMKSVHNILHICETLDSATKYSEKCCEELVAAGAIDKLLTVIRSASRSIPDQEVSKHALSTLRNLARYPRLTDELTSRNGSIQTIFWELLRNKEEGYFIASEVLKKICVNPKGVEAVRKLPALVKRLHGLVEELSRKATIEKRNAKGLAGRENSEKRLREAAELLKLITTRWETS